MESSKSTNKDVKRLGLYSGKYDSVKQRAVLLNGNRLSNYLCYNASLRLELLLTGKVILTDSMFCDGLYFGWMSEDPRYANNQLEAMLKFAEKTGAIEIRCREEKQDDIAQKMFHKTFYLSSLEPQLLTETILEFAEKHKGTLRMVGTLSEFLRMWRSYIELKLGSICVREWESFSRRMTYLFNAIDSFPSLIRKWDLNYSFENEFNDLMCEIIPARIPDITYREKMLRGYRQAVNMAIQEEPILREALEQDITNKSKDKIRSNIMNTITGILNDAQGHLASSTVENIMIIRNTCECVYNDRYCKNLAMQHEAQLIDVCEYLEPINDAIKSRRIEKIATVKLDSTVIELLANMSREKFEVLFMQSEGVRSTVCNQILDMNIPRDRFLTSLNNMVRCLNEYAAANIESYTYFPYKTGPWNPSNGFWYSEEDLSVYTLIGNGRDTEKKYGNEVCILHGKTLFRIRINNCKVNEDADMDFDTVIAPVDNIFNNGNANINGM